MLEKRNQVEMLWRCERRNTGGCFDDDVWIEIAQEGYSRLKKEKKRNPRDKLREDDAQAGRIDRRQAGGAESQM